MSDQHKKEPIKIFTALDLEMNNPTESQKIIQIGAVVGDITTGQVFEQLSVIINPHEKLTPFITTLTGITQEQVDNGVSLEEGYRQLKRLHEGYLSFVNPVVWGGGDSAELLKQLKIENPHFAGWCFGRRWIDVKTLFVSWRITQGLTIQGGLKNSCSKLGITFQGPAHDARLDALNTFHAYKAMLDKLRTIGVSNEKT